MLKFKLLLLFLSFSFVVCAQKCKPVVDEVDKFTKVSKIIYGGRLIENIVFSDKNQTVSLYFGKANDSLFIMVQLTKVIDENDMIKYDDAKEDMKMKKGANMYLPLANGESIILPSLYDSKLSKQKILNSLTVTMVAGFNLTPEVLEKLSNSLITGIRLDFAETSSLTANVKTPKAEKMKEQFNCAKARFLN